MEQPPNLSVIKTDKAIGNVECAISVLGGAYLLYDALKKEKKSLPEIAAAGFMIYKGVKGFIDNNEDRALKPERAKNHNINVHARLIVNRPVNEVYNFWRHLGNLPLFMEHLEGVTVLSDTLSEWNVKVPGLNSTLSWRSEIVAEEPHRFIGWRSVTGSSIWNAGKVEFKDAGELGTLLHVSFSYHAPAGGAIEEGARLLNPLFEKLVRNDIMGFKRYMETGTPQKLQQETVAIYT
ncbi:hypothetical protein GR160_11155 [Flavobacterium sp. Sd200]|uniref:SRPBCC family protein n=1 Tax=Flavobacterium sp. Sd200 TaxID=2692211 RepID=UPI00136E4589|nr:SRPBCC family protein [Flavobacterium sp. Sd200]MXN91783.1 hypothetical protein [Flavobacterium sp. Sd200]